MATGTIPIPRSSSRSSLCAAADGCGDAAAGPPAPGAAGRPSALAATDEGLQMLRELQGHNTMLRRELMGAGSAIDRLVNTVRARGALPGACVRGREHDPTDAAPAAAGPRAACGSCEPQGSISAMLH
ncbi:hypothetical protein MNEG_12737 [Monoraphidium neglectum]|jgi:hypothetical protein|uniref:Uncharacterized protein n=1 Tax=Monoraphidium neglectum TaxID=145388 RepID=A0A0D2LU87_9CHLO|nr:hypothetical protein MNEG_12737 [Monoraphidium neglectum]KIY95224.1 hypothetical protein MNEG_12737 [Monoraphidium neglectum]|eukprot:XP_013894244.1 hypothetical protein MNEG_12737 [Monoraphidium neglectum]